MKRIFVFTLGLALLLIASCSKNNGSIRPSFTWTYSGSTLSADTVQSSNGYYLSGVYTPAPQIYAQTGPWGAPVTKFTADLSSLSVGTYVGSFQNTLTMNNSSISPLALTITSSDGSTLSGTFSGTLNGLPISGTFSNVPILYHR